MVSEIVDDCNVLCQIVLVVYFGWYDDVVFDDVCWCLFVVLYQCIEGCNVNQQYCWVVYWMVCICGMLLWWIVFQVNVWQVVLFFGQQVVLVFLIGVQGLKQDVVEGSVGQLFDWDFDDVVVLWQRVGLVGIVW